MTKEKKTEKKTKVVNFEYEIDQLLKNCEAITGYKREVGEGAIHGLDVEKMTKTEFQNKVKEFLKRRVK